MKAFLVFTMILAIGACAAIDEHQHWEPEHGDVHLEHQESYRQASKLSTSIRGNVPDEKEDASVEPDEAHSYSVETEKKLSVHVDRPVPYTVEKQVPIVHNEYIEVQRPYAVHVERPVPVYVHKKVVVEKPVAVTVRVKELNNKGWGLF
ncbi:uncharacterized protein LOC129779993 [Toxorhynchites rutilus septentrionalis]|uniref:uncharacterized protein LOC129779993 n=1 Tax=Toxorhynchites rutilus septentrionalis TaxID=329112 RepID=UPI00247A5E7A|nr:uncharacterized protein LOC129779993 [Toxorhynchites rutilus septentrionalis]